MNDIYLSVLAFLMRLPAAILIFALLLALFAHYRVRTLEGASPNLPAWRMTRGLSLLLVVLAIAAVVVQFLTGAFEWSFMH